MASITTRASKGAPLSWNEADANFTNLNTDKVETNNPQTTGSLQHNGNVNLTGTGARITGDFSNATIANRMMFQTSAVNGNTAVEAIPNGASTASRWTAYGNSDPTNASYMQIGANGTSEALLEAGRRGSGSYLPMTFYTGGSERMRIDTSGNVGIGKTADSGVKLDVLGNMQIPSAADGYAFLLKYSTLNTGSRNWRIGHDISSYGDFKIQVSTTQTGDTFSDALTLLSDGSVLATSPAGLGYGTGSGGTVTQATSKSTAVTLNKPTGQITMHNAALAAGATAAFTLANSTLGGSDVLVATSSFSLAWNYRIEVRKVVSGFADICVTNLTGGSLSDALTISFAIIKGATS